MDSDTDDSVSENPEQALDSFRQQWQNELHKQQYAVPDLSSLTLEEESTEERARKLFLQAVDLEKKGKVFDAMKLYRKAVQLVPDIDFKVYEMAKNQKAEEAVASQESVVEEINDDDEDLTEVDLLARFQSAIMKSGRLIERSTGNKTIITGSSGHFCDLPFEVILLIFRWVVSSDLDVRSLDKCSQTCKGFYICARDPELWRAACSKVWGGTVGFLEGSPYLSWRDMFYQRHRVLFSGCYISKTSYIRMGENNFQDYFYTPIHLVEYYRLIRFYPDGSLVMLTSADDPQVSVAKLRNRHVQDSSIHRGQFRLINDQVMIVVKPQYQQYNRPSRRKANIDDTSCNRTFILELKIMDSKKRRFCKLEWSHYSVTQVVSKREVESEFELTPNSYPPFWFSRVKSFHSEADAALM